MKLKNIILKELSKAFGVLKTTSSKQIFNNKCTLANYFKTGNKEHY